MNAMIFAAGLGTRLKPLTDTMPKALVRVGGKSLLERVVARLNDAGADKIVVNVHHFADMVKDCLRDNDNFGADVAVSDESQQLLDTGGGIKKAASLFASDEPILIHNVDILSNVDLRKFYSMNADADALLLVSQRKTKRYLLFNDEPMGATEGRQMRLVGWTNIETGEVRSPYPNLDVSTCKMYAFSGIHIFSQRLFPLMEGFPEKFGIMDFYLNVCAKANIRGYLKEDLKLLDVGKLDSLSEAEKFISRKRIAIFASGSGTNAEAIARHFQDSNEVEVALVVSNKENAMAHQRMQRFNIPTCTFGKEEWHDGEKVLALMRQEQIDFIVLAGFLAFIPSSLIEAFPNRIVNIHPSLLPKYGGKGMWGMNVHRAVLEAGEKESGITIHHVTDEMDGGEIIFQAKCEVKPTDTPEELAQRIHQLEYEHYPQVVERLLK